MKKTNPTTNQTTNQMDWVDAVDAPDSALPDRDVMLALIDQWTELGWVRAVDGVFARFLLELDASIEPGVLLAAVLASHQLGRGHVCLDLAATLDNSRFALALPPEGDAGNAVMNATNTALKLPGDVIGALQLDAWMDALRRSPLVEEVRVNAQANSDELSGSGTPLVLACAASDECSGGRLYLRRYWQYEQDVLRGIHGRLVQSERLCSEIAAKDLAQGLDALFGPPASQQQEAETDWQRMACALMAASAFGVVTGGPGTGKTTTVVKLLALLQSLALHGERGRPLRIGLAAPTGKAAARLNESIAGAVAGLDLQSLAGGEAVRSHIPREVTTLHRLLGSRPDSRHFRHHRGQPLALDVLVIDEASMIDLEMMAAVLDALPPRARLLLLGDKDQLASVEAGAVLGSLCERAAQGGYWPQTAQWLQAAGAGTLPAELVDEGGRAIDQSIAMLRRSYRFNAESGIGRLAFAVNAGDAQAVRRVLAQAMNDAKNGAASDVAVAAITQDDEVAFSRLVVDGVVRRPSEVDDGPQGFGHYLRVLRESRPHEDVAAGLAHEAQMEAFDAWARTVLKAYGQFQVLCALRKGPWGVDGLNLRIARTLQSRGLIGAVHGWYLGRPVLVTRNDYALGLMNGDIGVTLALPQAGAQSGTQGAQGVDPQASLRVAFASADGSGRIRWVLPSRLQSVETVFAMTVHKSQGSEFTHAAFVLPDSSSPVITRELIYTGITRARRWFTLAGASRFSAAHAARLPVLDAAVGRSVHRASGLGDGLEAS